MLSEFRNEPYVDFSKPEIRKAQEEALSRISREFSNEYGLFINGREVKTGRTFKSYNPSHKDQVLAVFHKAGKEEVDLALQAALAAQEKWKTIDAKERAIVLLKAAQILRKRKAEVNAWMISEAGKTWIEAEADTAEAIDFLEFYGREAVRWSEIKGALPFANEATELRYIPLGVGAVIPPWNFPMAILTGMSSAALVTGNAVLLKPASDTPAIGWQFVKIMQEAGLPDGVLNFIPGSGAEI
ncbi:MAG TPA: aldehyde dehydrogenase family protein, partial [bacterium]|nr:aldehyde dehydrogenase family protein [bacterium]